MKKRTLAIAAFAVAAIAGCLKNDGSVSTPRAGVLLDLLSPNATNTTIVLNSNTIGNNVSYGSVPNLYNQVAPGAGNVTILNSSAQQLLNYNFTAESGKYYSIFLVDSASKMKAIAVTDSVNYPGTADSAKVRYYNFSPNSIGLSIGIKDSGNVMPSRSFETQASANASNHFNEIKAGTYTYQIFAPGNANSLKDTSITFEGKHIYTLFIKGFYTDTTGVAAVGLGMVKHG